MTRPNIFFGASLRAGLCSKASCLLHAQHFETKNHSYWNRCHPGLIDEPMLDLKTLPNFGTTDPRVEFISQDHLTKPSFRILTRIQLRNLNQTSTVKYWPNFSLNLAWTSTSKSWPNLVLKVWTKVKLYDQTQLPNLQQTVANTILIINISNNNNIKKFWLGIFTRQGYINQVY